MPAKIILARTETIPTLDASGNPVWRTTTRAWQQNDAGALVSQTERTPDGLQSWSWQIGQGPTPTDPDETFTQQGAKYTHTQTVIDKDENGDATRSWTTTATHTDNTQTIQTYTNGLLDTVDQGIHSTSYGYEDATNGIPGRLRTTTYTYDPTTLALDTETIITNGLTRVIDRGRVTLGRDQGWQLLDGSTVENEVEYSYHADHGRLSEISNPQISSTPFAYTYEPGSLHLIETLTGPAHSVTHTWSPTRNVLLAKENKTLALPPAPETLRLLKH